VRGEAPRSFSSRNTRALRTTTRSRWPSTIPLGPSPKCLVRRAPWSTRASPMAERCSPGTAAATYGRAAPTRSSWAGCPRCGPTWRGSGWRLGREVRCPRAYSWACHDIHVRRRARGHLGCRRPPKAQGVKIAGRISARDVLRVFGERRPRPELPPLCVDEANLAFAKTKVCAALDLPTQVVTQVVPTCDSMSFVFEGSAVAARLGAEAPPSPPPSGCADAGDYAKCP
jgi:hypothetical protein